jgi:hypothetical protein
MGCLNWFWKLFGGPSAQHSAKVEPKASAAMDFEGIDPSDFELKCLARHLSRDFVRGTSDRWKRVDQQLRQDLAPPGAAWEDAKALSAKALLAKSRQVYALRRAHVHLPAAELATLMKGMDRLLLEPGEHSAVAGAKMHTFGEEGGAAGGAAAAAAPAAPPATGDAAADEKKAKKGSVVVASGPRDYSAEAMKAVSVNERAALDLREEGFEYGEVRRQA